MFSKIFILSMFVMTNVLKVKADIDLGQCQLSLNCGGQSSTTRMGNVTQIQAPPGKRGPRGMEGQPGVQGQPGLKGEVGEGGMRGEKGSRGDTGAPGIKGIAGTKGQPGDSCQCPEIQALKEKLTLLTKHVTARSCEDIMMLFGVNKSVQSIYSLGNPVNVLCDIRSPTEKWTVIQRRFDGSQDFFLGWDSYKNGFGQPDGEYWLGLDIIHQLTSNEDQMLRVELEDHDGNHAYAEYTSFVVGPESDNYRLQIKGYSGNVGDSLVDSGVDDYNQNGMMFSTRDRDNDKSSGDCANKYKGGWWYNACYRANLNGLYIDTKTMDLKSMNWHQWKKEYEPLKAVSMMIKKNN